LRLEDHLTLETLCGRTLGSEVPGGFGAPDRLLLRAQNLCPEGALCGRIVGSKVPKTLETSSSWTAGPQELRLRGSEDPRDLVRSDRRLQGSKDPGDLVRSEPRRLGPLAPWFRGAWPGMTLETLCDRLRGSEVPRSVETSSTLIIGSAEPWSAGTSSGRIIGSKVPRNIPDITVPRFQNRPLEVRACRTSGQGRGEVGPISDSAALSIVWRAALGILVPRTTMRPFISLFCSWEHGRLLLPWSLPNLMRKTVFFFVLFHR
jgi:hypothetical protein